MAARFPLSEQLWREWLDDETEAASRCVFLRAPVKPLSLPNLNSAEDIDGIRALYERAVADFLSVPLWCAYIQVRAVETLPLARNQ